MTTAADGSLARGGRLHFGVPDTDIEVWLLDLDTLDAAARERLLALPSADRCLACQTAAEQSSAPAPARAG